MVDFFKTYVEPLKDYYISVGALIVIFTLLASEFKNLETTPFLLGLILFAISSILIYLLIKTFPLINSSISITALIYFILFFMFVLVFSASVYEQFKKPFCVFLGLVSGALIFKILVVIRGYFVILQKKLNSMFLKRVLRILFLILILILWGTFNSYIGERLGIAPYGDRVWNTVDDYLIGDLFFIPLMTFGNLFFIVGFVMTLIDIFRKKMSGSENFIWKKTKLYKLLNKK